MATATVTITLRLPERLVEQIDERIQPGGRNAYITRLLEREIGAVSAPRQCAWFRCTRAPRIGRWCDIHHEMIDRDDPTPEQETP